MRHQRFRWLAALLALGLVAAGVRWRRRRRRRGRRADTEASDFEGSPSTRAPRAAPTPTPATSPARGGRRADREVHAVQPRRGLPGQGGVLGRRHLLGRPARGDRRGAHRRPDRHRPLQARGLGARQPDRAQPPTRTTGATRPPSQTVVFRWGEESAQRLVELQSGSVDGIDNVGTEDFADRRGRLQPPAHRARPAQRLLPRASTSTSRRSTTRSCARRSATPSTRTASSRTSTPRARWWPTSSCRPASPATRTGADGFTYDPDRGPRPAGEAGYPDGVDLGVLSYRAAVRRLPAPAAPGGQRHPRPARPGRHHRGPRRAGGRGVHRQRQRRQPGFYMLGLGRRLPGRHQLLGLPLRRGRVAAVRHRVRRPARGAVRGRLDHRRGRARNELYAQANELLFQHAQALPDRLRRLGGGVQGRRSRGRTPARCRTSSSRPCRIEGQDQLVWMQNGEPSGLYCADETDGEALRVCEQINESLLAYEVGGTESVPSLATTTSPTTT